MKTCVAITIVCLWGVVLIQDYQIRKIEERIKMLEVTFRATIKEP